MKLMAFSDIHLDAVTAGRARRFEVIKFLATAVEIAHAEGVDLVIFAGDAHDPGSLLDPLYSSDLIRTFAAFLKSGGAPIVVAVAGNHDVVDTSDLFMSEPVTTLTPVRAARQWLSLDEAARLHVFERPWARKIADGWAVLALPYVSRVHADARAGWERAAFAQAAGLRKAGLRLIVVGHRVIPGARMSSESSEMAKGQDQLFPFAEVQRLAPVFVCNGHYHSRQVIPPGAELESNIVIPGSPVRFTFGEIDELNKGVLMADI